jgi:hypothetical protein
MYSGRDGYNSGGPETLEPCDFCEPSEEKPPVALQKLQSIRVLFNPDKVKPLSIVMMVRDIC